VLAEPFDCGRDHSGLVGDIISKRWREIISEWRTASARNQRTMLNVQTHARIRPAEPEVGPIGN
jgi:hypothetical protein